MEGAFYIFIGETKHTRKRELAVLFGKTGKRGFGRFM